MQDRMTATYILMTVAAQHKREERSSILSLLLDRMKSSTYVDIPWNWRQNTSSCFLEFLRLQQYTRCKRAARLHQHPEEKVTTNFLVCIVLHWHNCAAPVVRDPLFLLYLQSRTFILSPINCSHFLFGQTLQLESFSFSEKCFCYRSRSYFFEGVVAYFILLHIFTKSNIRDPYSNSSVHYFLH